MIIALHKNARTTPAVRAEIAASSDSAAVLAKLLRGKLSAFWLAQREALVAGVR